MTSDESFRTPEPGSAGEPPEPGAQEDDDEAREAQAEDPTSPERGFEQIEHHDTGQTES